MSLICYNLLSQHKAVNEYQSIGFLFEEISKSWIKPNLMERLWTQIENALKELAILFDTSLETILDKVLSQSICLKSLHKITGILTAET